MSKLNAKARDKCPLGDVQAWAQYFESLLNTSIGVNKNAAYHLLNAINTPDYCMSIDVLSAQQQRVWEVSQAVVERCTAAKSILDEPFTLDEVAGVLRKLPNGKAFGCEPVPSECYKYACRQEVDVQGRPRSVNVLVPVLHALLEHIRCSEDYPLQFQTTVVSPVFKKRGDPMQYGSYRGVAVGGALAKCYASLLLGRLVKAGEELKLRHPAQAGFRRGMSTGHQQFVMQHLITVHQRPGSRPLIVVQIDFEKAFDRVSRELMFERLKERGVNAMMLNALMCAYEHVLMRVKVNGKLSEPFNSTQGVKQGDPLSTELFGLFIEIIADYIDWRDSRYGCHVRDAPLVGGKRISLLLFADDLNLVATTPARMCALLEAVGYFCTAFGMRANVKKCECMVFGPSAEVVSECERQCMSVITPLELEGQRIPMVTSARYLGLVYGPGRSFLACRKQLVDSGRGAMFSLIGKLRRLRISAPDVWMRCFESHVRSILSFGCEVWGPDALAEMMAGGPPPRRRDSDNLAEGWFEACLHDPAVQLQVAFMRTTAGAHRPAHRLLFAELSQFPLHYTWAKQVIGFWNRVANQKDTPAHHALLAEIELALEGYGAGWASKVLKFAAALGVDVWADLPDGLDWPSEKAAWLLERPLNVATICTAFRERLWSAWSHPRLLVDPPAYPSDGKQPGIMMAKYLHWMGLPFKGAEGAQWLPHAQVFIPAPLHKLLMRFRMCCWPLKANRSLGVPRKRRVCPHCKKEPTEGTVAGEDFDWGPIEDERHVLMECPAYQQERAAAQLPETDDMLSVMETADQRKLAAFLRVIWDKRSAKECFTR
jgi:hypothetical protein